MSNKYLIAFLSAFITGIILTVSHLTEAVSPVTLPMHVEGNGVVTKSFGPGEFESRLCVDGNAYKATVIDGKAESVRYPAWDRLCDGDNPITE